ncbi:MAG: hypothetical protein JNJ45_05595 [Chthonomonas sp.]|nr:hypothetical protein [Chthonomonas sp.]
MSTGTLAAIRAVSDKTLHPHFRLVVVQTVAGDFGEETVELTPEPTILGRLRPIRADEVPGEFAMEHRELSRLTMRHSATIERDSLVSMGQEVPGAFQQLREWQESVRLIVLGDLSSKHEATRGVRSYLVARR